MFLYCSFSIIWCCCWIPAGRDCQVVPGKHGPLTFQMILEWCHRTLTGMPPFVVAMEEGCYSLWRLRFDDDDDVMSCLPGCSETARSVVRVGDIHLCRTTVLLSCGICTSRPVNTSETSEADVHCLHRCIIIRLLLYTIIMQCMCLCMCQGFVLHGLRHGGKAIPKVYHTESGEHRAEALSDDFVWHLSYVCLSRTSGLTREQRGLGRLKLAQR